MKYITYFGSTKLDKVMTEKQAENYGNKIMPNDLKRVGFKVTVFKSILDIHGSDYLRINFGK